MKNNYILLILLTLFIAGCSDDSPTTSPPESDLLLSEKIIGTFLLEKVDIECEGDTGTFQGDEFGCVDGFEVGCFGMEFKADGTLRLSADCRVQNGQYTVDDDTGTVTLCDENGMECILVEMDLDDMRFEFQPEEGDCEPVLTLIKSNSELEDIICPVVEKRIKRIIRDDMLYRAYEYYDNGDYKSRESYSSAGELLFTYEYTYETNKVIRKRTEASSGFVTTIEYDSSTGIANEFDEAGILVEFRKYTFGNGTCPTEIVEHFDANNELLYTESYEYTDDNCSFERTRLNANGTSGSSLIITNDDKKSWSTSITLSFFRNENPHNVLALRFINTDGSTSEPTSYDVTFEYDEDDYPFRSVQTSLSGTERVAIYEYE